MCSTDLARAAGPRAPTSTLLLANQQWQDEQGPQRSPVGGNEEGAADKDKLLCCPQRGGSGLGFASYLLVQESRGAPALGGSSGSPGSLHLQHMKRLELSQLPDDFWSSSAGRELHVNSLGEGDVDSDCARSLDLNHPASSIISLSELRNDGEHFSWVAELWFIAIQMVRTLPL